MANGMRQAQASSSPAVKACCMISSTRAANTWPPISVTYWNEL